MPPGGTGVQDGEPRSMRSQAQNPPQLEACTLLDGRPQLVPRLRGDPTRAIPVKVPGRRIGGHPDLPRRSMAVHDVPRAVTKAQGQDPALQLDVEVVVFEIGEGIGNWTG